LDDEFDVEEIFRQANERHKAVACSECGNEHDHVMADPNHLLECYESLNEYYPFKAGTLATWKPFMKDARLPVEGEACVVLEVFDPPIKNTITDPRTRHIVSFQQVSLVIGVIDDDGDFWQYAVDGRRFMPWRGNA
jgi:hypothetical protein